MSLTGWVLIGAAGGLAAVFRYLLDAEIARLANSPFPIGILAVNLTGALLVGLAAGSALSGQTLTIVAGGLIGSFTTFSTWILDTHKLALLDQMRLAWLNIAVSTVAGLAAVVLGHAIAV